MADLSITATSIDTESNTNLTSGIAGEALDPGETAYLNTDQRWYKSLSSGTDIQARTKAFVMTKAGTAGDPVSLAIGGDLVIGATLTLKTLYVQSANTGKIAPFADLVSTNYVSPIGIPRTTTVMRFLFEYTDFQTP